ncbi:sensor histidine kinase [Cryptosporangium aurantiacum]|uniref:histidine kinase n=1 Tax=Cryptosporangium aurantiacum TaxID=134849 RepID=A0A1M7RMN2_9ACTN|nr:sensor histidine kinase [Cryptosporangium aurantiacum]SHN47362.1 Signal transduction histidine kinase [Cryptosporangium aurantiacum]
MTTLGAALQAGPRRFFLSLWPLRAVAYLASGVLVGTVTLVWLPVALLVGAGVGVPLLTLPLVALERRRTVLLGGPALTDPHRRPERPGVVGWLRSRYAEPVTWRELAYLVLHGTVLLVLDVIAIALVFAPVLVLGLGSWTRTSPAPGGAPETSDAGAIVVVTVLIVLTLLVLMVAASYVVPLAAVAHGSLARLLLAPGAEAAVRTLTHSRARLIDAFEVERRRIERDLHDGAQQHLLELGVTLVTAELEFDDDPQAAKALLRRAADQSAAALAELRELIRGIHPQVLTDLGLAAAVAELADRSTTPVDVALDLPHRLPSTVESTAYFVVTEALSNAAKHAAATTVTITGGLRASRLVIEVRDDGVGGADAANGTGLTGLADRVDAVDGTLTLASPPGGPTVLTLDLPWRG